MAVKCVNGGGMPMKGGNGGGKNAPKAKPPKAKKGKKQVGSFNCELGLSRVGKNLVLAAEITKNGNAFAKFTCEYTDLPMTIGDNSVMGFMLDVLGRVAESLKALQMSPSMTPDGMVLTSLTYAQMCQFEGICVLAVDRLLDLGKMHAKAKHLPHFGKVNTHVKHFWKDKDDKEHGKDHR